MKRTRMLSWLLIAIISLSGVSVHAAPKKKEKKKKEKTEQVATPPETPYSKIIKDCQKQEGLFTTYLNDKNELFFEIPDSLLGRDYLISNRMAATSD
ncbi:MAG: DUF5118 domain-containing protein, partial [Bacteroidaceae bacterium]|nr:DUF5118 domain-containing protein [Bacteroidaceae bacterium]